MGALASSETIFLSSGSWSASRPLERDSLQSREVPLPTALSLMALAMAAGIFLGVSISLAWDVRREASAISSETSRLLEAHGTQ